ncbi:MAG: UDP-N-acetylmuramate dehydrogenase [Clostridia bacterium]|nr:UDP-N-acetylmuramate dehydrogenase [Clostridia bacterium]
MEELEQKKSEEPSDLRYQIQWKKNEPMSRHTTFRIGGSAVLYAVCDSRESLVYLIRECSVKGFRYIVLGNGSNVLFSDEGFDGIVISTTGMNRVEITDTCITAEAGASLTAVSKSARDASLTGMEFANGIPGSIGGAVFMNAGAYDGEMKNIVTESTYLDTTDGRIYTITGEDHSFGYRESIYREHPEWIILSAKFSLVPGNKDEITAKMDDFMNRRVSKQPLEYPSAGSVFKRYPGRYTAQMIDESGLKGTSVGGAQVSEKHAGFIINTGGATSRDVTELIEKIQNTIYENYGIHIETELIRIP